VTIEGRTEPPQEVGVRSAAEGYDQVRWRSPEGTDSTWTRAQFEALGLVERVRLLAGGELRFFRQGQEVSPRAALTRSN
jgi:hypothetical protein